MWALAPQASVSAVPPLRRSAAKATTIIKHQSLHRCKREFEKFFGCRRIVLKAGKSTMLLDVDRNFDSLERSSHALGFADDLRSFCASLLVKTGSVVGAVWLRCRSAALLVLLDTPRCQKRPRILSTRCETACVGLPSSRALDNRW